MGAGSNAYVGGSVAHRTVSDRTFAPTFNNPRSPSSLIAALLGLSAMGMQLGFLVGTVAGGAMAYAAFGMMCLMLVIGILRHWLFGQFCPPFLVPSRGAYQVLTPIYVSISSRDRERD
jgi:uncharacterized membrane protein YphA (DoxX/SURF4 family)